MPIKKVYGIEKRVCGATAAYYGYRLTEGESGSLFAWTEPLSKAVVEAACESPASFFVTIDKDDFFSYERAPSCRMSAQVCGWSTTEETAPEPFIETYQETLDPAREMGEAERPNTLVEEVPGSFPNATFEVDTEHLSPPRLTRPDPFVDTEEDD